MYDSCTACKNIKTIRPRQKSTKSMILIYNLFNYMPILLTEDIVLNCGIHSINLKLIDSLCDDLKNRCLL